MWLVLISAVLVVAAGVATVLVIVNQPPEPPADAAAAVEDSAARFAELDGANYQGSFLDATRGPVSVDVTGTAAGGISGSVTIHGVEADIRADDTGTYLRAGADFWVGVSPAAADVVADRWVRAPDDLLATDLREVLAPAEFARIASCEVGSSGQGSFDVANQDPITVDGERVWAVESADCGTVYISVEEPHRIVRVEGVALDPDAAPGGDRSIGFVLGVGEISKAEADEVTTQIGDAATEAQDAPDPTDPSTLPPLYTVSGGLGGDCGDGGCTTSVPITNIYGPGDGTELAGRLNADSRTGPLLGTCTVPVPALGHLEETTVSCTIATAEWDAFLNSIPAGESRSAFWSMVLPSPDWPEGYTFDYGQDVSASPETISTVQEGYGGVGLEILSAATSGETLTDEAVLALLEQAASFGGLNEVRALLGGEGGGVLGNPQDLPAVVEAIAGEFPTQLGGLRGLEEAAALVGEGATVQVRPGVVNVVNETEQEVLAVVSQLVEDPQAFAEAVQTAFAELEASDVAAQGFTPTVAMTVEPYVTSLYGLTDKADVLAEVKQLGVGADDFAADGILEVRTGNGAHGFTADDVR